VSGGGDATEGERGPYNSATVCPGGRVATLTLCLYSRSRESGHDRTSSDISLIASKVDILSPEIATYRSVKVVTTTRSNRRLSDHPNHPLLGYSHHI
jgi:hypothetical protein